METDEVRVVDLAALARLHTVRQPVWAYGGDDLNVNLLVFEGDEGVVEHMNTEVDVLLVGIAGEGVVAVEGTDHPVRAGQALVIPKGGRRAIRSAGRGFTYLTCHRRRGGLWPQGAPRPDERRTDGGQEQTV